MPKYEFPRGVPLALKVVMTVALANFVLWFATGLYVREFAPLQRSGVNSFATYWKGGLVRFVPPSVGYYLKFGFWVHFLALAVCLVMVRSYAKTGQAVGTSSRYPR
jgi:hypothetical protein